MSKASDSSLVLVQSFPEGLRTDVEADKAPNGSLVKAENLRWIPSGGFVTRLGSQKVTAWSLGTGKKIENMEPMLEFGLMFMHSDTKVFQAKSDSAAAYDIGLTLTTGYRCRFKEYNSQMKITNGKDNYINVNVARVLTQFTDASSSIVVEPGNADLFISPVSGTFTADASADTISYTGGAPANGDRIAFWSSGTLPAGLTAGVAYFVRNVSTATTFQVSATATGSIIDITDTGSGTHSYTTGILHCKGNLITYTLKKSQTFTADSTTDVITSAGHDLRNDDVIQVSNSGGALPTGLSASTDYYVIAATTDTFQLSATLGGAKIDITGNGTGTQTFTALTGGDIFAGTLKIPTGTYEVGSIITQNQDVLNAPKGNVIETIYEKMVVAGVSPAPHVEYYSNTASTAAPGNIDDFSPDTSASPAIVRQELFGKFGTITGMRSLLEYMYVAKQKGIEAWTGIDSSGIPVRQPFSEYYGVANADCFIIMADKLVFLNSPAPGIKSIEVQMTGFYQHPTMNPFFDAKIQQTVLSFDTSQANARMGYNELDRLMRATVSISSVNNTLIFDNLTQNWSIDTGIVANCWAEYNGSMYFGSSNDDSIYKAETGYLDDSTPPRLDAVTPIHYFGSRRTKVPIFCVVVTGLIKTKTQATVNIYCDGMLARTFTIDGTADYVNTSQARPFGRDFAGRDAFGYASDTDNAKGFTFTVPIGVNVDATNVQIEFISQGTGYRFQVDSYEIVRGKSGTADETQYDIR